MMTSVTSVTYGESKEIVVAFLAQYLEIASSRRRDSSGPKQNKEKGGKRFSRETEMVSDHTLE